MKKISDIVGNSNKTIELSENIIKKLLDDSYINNFVKSNNLSKEDIYKNFSTIYEYYRINRNIDSNFYKPQLSFKNNIVELKYNETEEYKQTIAENRWYNRLKTEYISKSVLNSSFSNLTIDAEKSKVAKELITICNNKLNKINTKGLYIYGKTGIGKTYLMGCIYNYLLSKNLEPAIIYFPEFVRKMKSKIINSEYTYIIDEIRKQEVLIIDDIGAENITEFVRDEILVPIINYRSSENLLTFFTSNLDIRNLSETLSNTKNTIDETKAMRILDRIKYLAKPIYLDSKNEREFL
ncbi:primosomal protein DnaI [Gemelliphila palaticanis]|uniref:Primosomal protein DnaI n=1 Tax=Gemelliphila palaticanis TaxID=81950 RepID=A0ABX2T043_9BACL|nr:primosomal protein DnaI [Gemella palaticanis]MBF0715062.1 primosomal protein DnaI [Gemella palaticanis]NYS46992.1 primosomal protein DnaI [Gemella palaticanis]